MISIRYSLWSGTVLLRSSVVVLTVMSQCTPLERSESVMETVPLGGIADVPRGLINFAFIIFWITLDHIISALLSV